MGSRANYAILENSSYRLYYSHWGAQSIDRDLFWGPQFARAFIEQQTQVGTNEWLDNVWCEGGAVVDFDRHRLTLFGGEDIQYEIALRRFYLRLLAASWKPWLVHWAFDEIAELANGAGCPSDKVMARKDDPPMIPAELRPPRDNGVWHSILITATWETGALGIYPLFGYSLRDMLYGPPLLQRLAVHPSVDHFIAPEGNWPRAGAHINTGQRQIHFWSKNAHAGLQAQIAELWPDWTVAWEHDDYESHVRHAMDKITFLQTPTSQLAKRIEEYLLFEPSPSPVDKFNATTQALLKHGMNITEVNPLAMLHTACQPPRDIRERIVRNAIATLPTPS